MSPDDRERASEFDPLAAAAEDGDDPWARTAGEVAGQAESPRFGALRGPQLALSAVIVGGVLVGYGLPFRGFWLSLFVPFVLYFTRRELWGAAAPRGRLLAVLVWVGLWLPAVSYFFTGWYWVLTGDEISTAWLLIPLCGPNNVVVATWVPALVATVMFASGLAVSIYLRRPWVVAVAAWLAPWAHQLTFTAVAIVEGC